MTIFTLLSVLSLLHPIQSFIGARIAPGSHEIDRRASGLPSFFHPVRQRTSVALLSTPPLLIIINDDDDEEEEPYDDDDDDEDEEVEDPYMTIAAAEFLENPDKKPPSSSALANANPLLADAPTTNVDWGGALGRLRQRVGDVESGKSKDPSTALFRLMSSQSPNQQIGSFIQSANPSVVEAMSGAVSSLLGGLSQPTSGVETIVKSSGDKIGSLCFQLQMTGYMFRNAHYAMALKDLLDLKGSATLQDYRDAFDDLDSDGSGYIEKSEVRELLDTVYEGKTPAFEVDAFMQFFDVDNDGKVSWAEFERGLGTAMARQNQANANLGLLRGKDDDDDDVPEVEPEVSGKIEVELDDGKVVEVEAAEYVESLKQEARALKAALRREAGIPEGRTEFLPGMQRPPREFGGIASYIASRGGDTKALTEGISPEIVETMKMLVDFVLEGGESGKAPTKPDGSPVPKEEMQMEIPSAALQQLALWQLILGYRLREAEAKGDYLKLLE